MKKYFFLITSMLAAVMMSACSKDDPSGNPGGDNPGNQDNSKSLTFNKAEGAYYGEIKGEGVGCYSILFSNDIGDKLRVYCFGSVSTNARNARLTSGDYKPGNIDEPVIRTFATSASENDEGTMYWKNDKASPIDGGTMTVQFTSGAYSIRFAFTSGDEQINATFNGEFTLANEAAVPPRPTDPNPRPVSDIIAQYYGNTISATDGALFAIRMFYKGSSSSPNNVEAIQIAGYMPPQEHNNDAHLVEGVYTISTNDEDKSAFTLVSGSVIANNGGYLGTYEYYTTQNGSISKTYVITEGTMTVTKNDDVYTIVTDFKGYRADQTGIISDKLENVVYEYTGKLGAMSNHADPASNLDRNVNLGDFTNNALCQVVQENIKIDTSEGAKTYSTYYYYVWGEGLDVKIDLPNSILEAVGEGPMIMLYIIGQPSYNEPPTGTYPMATIYGVINYGEGFEDGCAQPGATILSDNSLDPRSGCWYTEVTSTSKETSMVVYAGAIGGADNGWVKTSNDGDTHNVEFLFTDLNGHTITGNYAGPMTFYDATPRSQSLTSAAEPFLYMPSVTMHNAVAAPMTVVFK